jgi:glycosyltransferase involved in cell wall biosynthesis
MKFAFIATYPPRECGIGTFTNNLFKSMLNNDESREKENEGFIVAISDHEFIYEYPSEVKLEIRQDLQKDYLEAVEYINLSGADICILEHEFGIFGGQDGNYILPLLSRLKIPLIVTLHTILKTPSYSQKTILQEICKMADLIVVMSHKAVEFLVDIYRVPIEKIALFEHGVPDIYFKPEICRKEFKIEKRKVLLTFGFIGRNKGIETVIQALPEIVKKHPEVLYIVLGKTHPNVLRESGEEYRIYLMRLAKSLHVEENVVFLNKFLDEQNLFKYLYACDIYITPYLNEAQITSGTLSYAVGIGAGVVSTPYWHAAELLAEGRGRLFDFGDYKGLSNILNDLFDNSSELKAIKQNAYVYGLGITWPKTGEKYLKAAEDIVKREPKRIEKANTELDLLVMPPFSLNHINRMTDDTGIIQHAEFGIPNLKEGYCMDDNARALLMVIMDYRQMKNQRALELSTIYLSYIHYMQNPDGTFRNFLSFSRNFLDEVGSEDSFGRTIWALGFLLGNAPNYAFYQSGKQLFFNATPNFEKLKSIRSIANTIIGISYYLKSTPSDENMIGKLKNLSFILVKHYDENSTADWQWFEQVIAYDNGLLPLALLHAAEILNDEKIKKTAIESMDFLTKVTLKDQCLSIVGNENWFKKDGVRSIFSQQPVDAMAMVLMYHQAFHLTMNKEYLSKLYTCFLWFIGENDLKVNLYDFETNGCYDGFDKNGVNRNQGAESTLAYLISYLAVLQAYEEFNKVD